MQCVKELEQSKAEHTVLSYTLLAISTHHHPPIVLVSTFMRRLKSAPSTASSITCDHTRRVISSLKMLTGGDTNIMGLMLSRLCVRFVFFLCGDGVTATAAVECFRELVASVAAVLEDLLVCMLVSQGVSEML